MARRNDNACGRMPLLIWIILIFLGTLFFMVAYGIGSAAPESVGNPIMKSLLYVAGAIIILLLYSLCIRVFERRKVSELRFSNLPKGLTSGMGIGILYFCIIVAFLALCGCYRVQEAHVDWKSISTLFAMFFLVAVGEEVVFRGILFRMIDQRYNTLAALIFSGLTFGFMHIFNPGAGVFSSLCIAIEAGILLGAAYKYSESLWMPIGIHWTWNFFQGPIFGLNVSGSGVGYSLIQPEVSGHHLLTGGAFGPEASIPAAVLGLAIAILMLRKIASR